MDKFKIIPVKPKPPFKPINPTMSSVKNSVKVPSIIPVTRNIIKLINPKPIPRPIMNLPTQQFFLIKF